MTIQELRQKYPMYDVLPDDVLRAKVSAKYPNLLTDGPKTMQMQQDEVQLENARLNTELNRIQLQKAQQADKPAQPNAYLQKSKPPLSTFVQKAATPTKTVTKQASKPAVKSSPLPKMETKKKGLLESTVDIFLPQTKQFASNFLTAGKNSLADIGDIVTGVTGTPEQKKKAGQSFIARQKETEEAVKKAGPKAGLKTGLELGSYLVPVGKGIKAGIGAGATVGALQGASKDLSAGDTLKGAAGGAAVGGALGAIGKGLQALFKNVPERIMTSILKESPKATKQGVRGGTSLGKEALERGEVGSIDGIYKKALQKVEDTENELQNVLMSSKEKVSTTSVRKAVDPMVQKLKDSGNVQGANSILERIANIEKEAGTKIPAARANEIKRTLYDEVRKSYGDQASAGKELIKTLARGFKEEIGKIKGVSNLNKDLSYYGRVADAAEKKIAGDSGKAALGLGDMVVGAGGFAAGMGPAALGAVAAKKALGSTPVKTAIAQGLNKAGKVVENKNIEALTSGMGRTSQVAGAKLATLPSIPSTQNTINNSPTQQNNQPNHILNTTTVLPQIQDPAQTSYITGYSPEVLYSAYKEAIGKEDTATADVLYSMYQDEVKHQEKNAPQEEKKLSAVAAKDLSRNQTALRAIEDLEKEMSGGDFEDQAKIIMSSLPGSLGARKYRSLWGSIIDTLGTNRTGAAYTIDQRKDYAHLMPVPGDDAATIAFKIQNIKNEIDNYVNNLQNTNPSEGYMPEITPQQ